MPRERNTTRPPRDADELLDLPQRGILLTVAGSFGFSLQDVIIKSISGGYSIYQIVFVRSLFAITVLLLIVQLEGGLVSLRTQRLWFHLARGAIMFMSYTCYYMALAALPLANTVAFFFSAPLFVTALSAPFLGERVRLPRWLAVITGFAGVLVMLQPGAGVVDPVALLAVLAALLYAIALIMTRRLGRTDSGSAMALYSTVLYLAVSGVAGLVMGRGASAAGEHASLQFLLRAWTLPSWSDLGLMALCGLISGFAVYCLSQAYRITRVTAVAPFEYIALPLGILWGVLFWRDLPQLHTVVGMVLVVGSGLWVLWRESRQERASVQSVEGGPPIRH